MLETIYLTICYEVVLIRYSNKAGVYFLDYFTLVNDSILKINRLSCMIKVTQTHSDNEVAGIPKQLLKAHTSFFSLSHYFWWSTKINHSTLFYLPGEMHLHKWHRTRVGPVTVWTSAFSHNAERCYGNVSYAAIPQLDGSSRETRDSAVTRVFKVSSYDPGSGSPNFSILFSGLALITTYIR